MTEPPSQDEIREFLGWANGWIESCGAYAQPPYTQLPATPVFRVTAWLKELALNPPKGTVDTINDALSKHLGSMVATQASIDVWRALYRAGHLKDPNK